MLYAFDSSEFCAVLHRRGKLTFDIPSDSIRKKTHRKRPDVGHHQLCCVCPTIVKTVPIPKKGELTPDIPSGSISCEKRPNVRPALLRRSKMWGTGNPAVRPTIVQAVPQFCAVFWVENV